MISTQDPPEDCLPAGSLSASFRLEPLAAGAAAAGGGASSGTGTGMAPGAEGTDPALSCGHPRARTMTHGRNTQTFPEQDARNPHIASSVQPTVSLPLQTQASRVQGRGTWYAGPGGRGGASWVLYDAGPTGALRAWCAGGMADLGAGMFDACHTHGAQHSKTAHRVKTLHLRLRRYAEA